MNNKLIKRFKNICWREELFNSGDKLVVAFSGGSDSVALTELLLAGRQKWNLELVLVHINYHQRGEESEEDERFGREFARQRKIKFITVDYPIGQKECRRKNQVKIQKPEEETDKEKKEKESYQKEELKEKILTKCQAKIQQIKNREKRWREFRYCVLEEIRCAERAAWVLTAHHRDDQVETFWLNLYRGAGVVGLSGMKLQDRERKLLRPLLYFSKAELKNFLKQCQQKWREDSSNANQDFFRNKIRHGLIPYLRQEYGTTWEKHLTDSMQHLQAFRELWSPLIKEKSAEVTHGDISEQKVVVDRKSFLNLAPILRPLIFRHLLNKILGNLDGITENHYQEFWKVVRSQKGKNQTVKTKKYTILRQGDKITIKTKIIRKTDV